jgi:hypothetical protein
MSGRPAAIATASQPPALILQLRAPLTASLNLCSARDRSLTGRPHLAAMGAQQPHRPVDHSRSAARPNGTATERTIGLEMTGLDEIRRA